MGSTYDTDIVSSRDAIALTLHAALVIKALNNLMGCNSWLLARLAIKETRERFSDLQKEVERGSKD